MVKRLDAIIQLLQVCYIFMIAGLLIMVSVGVIYNFHNLEMEYDTNQFTRRITKIAICFVFGILIAHFIPYMLFFRKIAKHKSGRRMKRFFTGNLVEMGLLFGLGISLIIVFFYYPNFFVLGFFIVLFVIALAKRPNHFRFFEKTHLDPKLFNQ